MFEQILQSGEAIELQENCDYCGDGALAMVNTGWAILTNKRFIVCKDKDAIKQGVKAGALIGVFGVLGGILAKDLEKKDSDKAAKVDEAEVSFERENIESVADGNRGVRKMLVIKTRSGDICKIGVKDKEAWRASLSK